MKLIERRRPWGQWAILVVFLSLLLAGAELSLMPTYNASIITYSHTQQRAALYAFPDGGRVLIPGYRLIALYGTPEVPELGALGQQPLTDTIARAKALAATYQPLITEHAYPTLEIITTVAAGFPTAAGTYSYAVDQATLATWVDAASKAGLYVVLDLQPGREDFLTQAERYESLLLKPNVGLALDPEWRLKPTEFPLQQIGSVSSNEVNQTAAWLAGIVKEHKLPQKLFLLHEFSTSMLPDRGNIDTSHTELAYVIQMDGQGTQSQKQDTWAAITAVQPANTYFGWKNFYTKDAPVRSPAETMQLAPKPWYVSYQ